MTDETHEDLLNRRRIRQCLEVAELGPRILFFSGGTAIKELSRTLKEYTHNSVHVVTPFDSGGSSARLRDAFDMLAVGDLRNRLMALADEGVRGNQEVRSLFAHRLPRHETSEVLARRIREMVEGVHPLVRDVPEPMQRIVRIHLKQFLEHMPEDFDLRGASIGNLALAAGFLERGRDIDAVISLFSMLVAARGHVSPVTEAPLHLAAELADGARVVGQHRLTGKEEPALAAPVTDLYLVEDRERAERTRVAARDSVCRDIQGADLVCYPMGSFYTSLVANLLPTNVGRAIVRAGCRKVYVPNTGIDPEQLSMSVPDCVEAIVDYVRRDAGPDTPIDRILDTVLLDPASEHYVTPIDADRIRALGVQVLETRLVSTESPPHHDTRALAELLITLAD